MSNRKNFFSIMFARTTRLYILLALTIGFFFVEIICGYYAGSIALIADSFHMLSDVLSMIIAVYAIKASICGSFNTW
jgi:zinc transporter 1